MNAREWLAAYAEKLGTEPPTTEEFSKLLDVAAEAAHSSERVAAPVACWLVAMAGVEPHQAVELAREVQAADSES
ncbi:MAG TPA: DUF6457 domain-containing protein [Solirubrobacteraceae bacterium]|nr:DUF6457 domain-containing protein [Solirubrobacteraceae bacterium]